MFLTSSLCFLDVSAKCVNTVIHFLWENYAVAVSWIRRSLCLKETDRVLATVIKLCSGGWPHLLRCCCLFVCLFLHLIPDHCAILVCLHFLWSLIIGLLAQWHTPYPVCIFLVKIQTCRSIMLLCCFSSRCDFTDYQLRGSTFHPGSAERSSWELADFSPPSPTECFHKILKYCGDGEENWLISLWGHRINSTQPYVGSHNNVT